MTSRVSDKPELSAYEKWELPNVGVEKKQQTITAVQVEEIQEQAYREGFEKGHQEGIEKGLTDARIVIEQRLAQLDSILGFLARPLEDLDTEVVQQTAELAMLVAQQVVRRELKIDPGDVIAVVREAIQILPVSARNVRVFLHPEDAELVRQAFSVSEDSDEQMSWVIKDDPLLSRGGCRIQAENSSIDASIEKRLHRVIAAVLGGERAEDNND